MIHMTDNDVIFQSKQVTSLKNIIRNDSQNFNKLQDFPFCVIF